MSAFSSSQPERWRRKWSMTEVDEVKCSLAKKVNEEEFQKCSSNVQAAVESFTKPHSEREKNPLHSKWQSNPNFVQSMPTTNIKDHTLPVEQGGCSLIDIKRQMMAENKVQEEIVPALYTVLEETMVLNDNLLSLNENRNLASDPDFQPFAGSPLPITRLVSRIIKYANCSRCNLVIGLLYLERLKRKKPDFLFTSDNCAKLFLVAVLTSTKVWEDVGASNAHWAEIGGVTLKEINFLELHFIFMMAFDFLVSTEDYKDFICIILGLNDVNSTEESESNTMHPNETPLFYQPQDLAAAQGRSRRITKGNTQKKTPKEIMVFDGPTHCQSNTTA